MSELNNLDLWDKVKKTDPEFTKSVSQRGGYTSVSPQYQIKCATEQFGAYGQGWGFESCEIDLSQLEVLGLAMVKAVFFFTKDGERHTFPINNSWPVKMGAKVDNDFAKKAETNTMSKALSKLGFSADIFMGEFDNPDYVDAVNNEFSLEKAENKIDEQARQQEEHEAWVESSLKTLSTCQGMNELKKVYSGLVRKANLLKDDTSIIKFTKTKDERKLQLEEKDDISIQTN